MVFFCFCFSLEEKKKCKLMKVYSFNIIQDDDDEFLYDSRHFGSCSMQFVVKILHTVAHFLDSGVL